MKIAESSVIMESNRSYRQNGIKPHKSGADGSSFLDSAFRLVNGKNNDSYEKDEEDYYNNYGNGAKNSNQFNFGKFSLNRVSDSREITDIAEEFSFQYDLFYLLFRRLLYGGVFGGMGVSAFPVNYDSVFQQRIVTYSEEENTEFHAKGQALTEDGRRIDFNLDISMSRSYMEYMDVSIPIATNSLLDPLVINVDSGVTQISDQKFMFDLDADGTEEEMSMLKKGSGFLALDLNEDGKINDGSELFGTKSGDGFKDLRNYDKDGNGWIDENDEVFDKLKVWFKAENGEDVLMNLKAADIGAIYLGEAQTEFTLGNSFGNRSGVIRSTGFFLKESLGVGTVQHVDMAVSKAHKGFEMKLSDRLNEKKERLEKELDETMLKKLFCDKIAEVV